jgi:hypothetical protein
MLASPVAPPRAHMLTAQSLTEACMRVIGGYCGCAVGQGGPVQALQGVQPLRISVRPPLQYVRSVDFLARMRLSCVCSFLIPTNTPLRGALVWVGVCEVAVW